MSDDGRIVFYGHDVAGAEHLERHRSGDFQCGAVTAGRRRLQQRAGIDADRLRIRADRSGRAIELDQQGFRVLRQENPRAAEGCSRVRLERIVRFLIVLGELTHAVRRRDQRRDRHAACDRGIRDADCHRRDRGEIAEIGGGAGLGYRRGQFHAIGARQQIVIGRQQRVGARREPGHFAGPDRYLLADHRRVVAAVAGCCRCVLGTIGRQNGVDLIR